LGSSFSLRDKGRENLLDFLHKCKQAGSIIIYDPNARRHLAGDPQMMKKILENISLATIIKGSDEDFHFIFKSNRSIHISELIRDLGPLYLIYTKGSKGAEFFTANLHFELNAMKINVVSTIGAGDNFSAGVIFGIYHKLLNNVQMIDFSAIDWQYIMTMGSFFASRVCESTENYISLETAKRINNYKIP
jgi:fructokinase